MKFHTSDLSPRSKKTPLRLEKVGPSRGRDFGAIVCEAFGLIDASVPLLAGLATDDRWHLFVSYSGDEPAGAGALFVSGENGWLEWGATSPKFRRQGSQGAIMAARINLARELGCRHLFTETGEAVPGDLQHSYRNIEKAGFQASILRLNYAPKR